jgi:hypothetical protein
LDFILLIKRDKISDGILLDFNDRVSNLLEKIRSFILILPLLMNELLLRKRCLRLEFDLTLILNSSKLYSPIPVFERFKNSRFKQVDK